MRIISGKYRRRNLFSPPETVQTRPIPDRVKESIFGILRGNIAGARVLDVFAGTGSIGLEAISRGAEHCIFVERDRRAAEILERNINALGCQDQCTIVRADALGPAPLTRINALGGVDLIFFDPPYPLIRDNAPGGGWDRVRVQFQRCVSLLSDSGFAALRTPWPFRHPETPLGEITDPDAAREARKGKWKKGKPRRADDLDGIETEWIGSDIDIEAIQRETRELEERLNQRDQRNAPGAGERDADGKSSLKRHLTLADLDDDDLDDENADDLPMMEDDDGAGDEDGGDWDDNDEGDADVHAEAQTDQHGEHESTDPAIVYHIVDLTMEGADGPETHEYGSTAVHLYMRSKSVPRT